MAEPATPLLPDELLFLIGCEGKRLWRAIGEPNPTEAKKLVDELYDGPLTTNATHLKATLAPRSAKKKYWKYSGTKGPKGKPYLSSDARDVLLSAFGLTHSNGLKEKFNYATRWLQSLELFGFGEGKNFPAELQKVQAEFAAVIAKYGDKMTKTVVFDGPVVTDPVPEPEPVVPVRAVDETVAGGDPLGRSQTLADMGVTEEEEDDAGLDPTVRLDPVPAAHRDPDPEPEPAPRRDPEPDPEPVLRPAPAPRRRKRRLKLGRLFRTALLLAIVLAAVFALFEIPAISGLQARLGYTPPVRATFWQNLRPAAIVETIAGDPESTADVDWEKAKKLGERVEARGARLAEVRKSLLAAKEEYRAVSYRKRLGQLYDGPYKADVENWVEFEQRGMDEYYSVDAKLGDVAELRRKIESQTATRSEIQALIDIEKALCEKLGIEWRANAVPLPTEGEHTTKGALGQLNRANRLRSVIGASPARDTDRTIETILSEKK